MSNKLRFETVWKEAAEKGWIPLADYRHIERFDKALVYENLGNGEGNNQRLKISPCEAFLEIDTNDPDGCYMSSYQVYTRVELDNIIQYLKSMRKYLPKNEEEADRIEWG